MEGTYEFTFGDIRSELAVRIDLKRGETLAFSAELRGRKAPLDNRTLLRTLLRHPLVPHLTMSRIYRQAAKLYFLRKLPYHPKPIPVHPMTMRTVTAIGLAELVPAAHPGSTEPDRSGIPPDRPSRRGGKSTAATRFGAQGGFDDP